MSDQPSANQETIVITGCGWLTPFACGSIEDVVRAIPSAKVPMSTAPTWEVPNEFAEKFPELSSEVRRDKSSWLAAAALSVAARQAGLSLEGSALDRTGLVLGCALAGQQGMIEFAAQVRAQSPRFVSPIAFPQTVGNYPAGALARQMGFRGPNLTIATGAASGLVAITEAQALLMSHRADAVFAGGVDSLGAQVAGVFSPSAPIESEGACIFLLERSLSAYERVASVLAVLCGVNDGTHDTRGRRSAFVLRSVGCPADVRGAPRPDHRRSIEIAQRIGYCHAALGASTVAAGIAGLRGLLPLRELGCDADVGAEDVKGTHRFQVCDASVASPATGEHHVRLKLPVK